MEESDCVRFSPEGVEGFPATSEVAIFSDRLEICTAGHWVSFHFKDMVAGRGSRLAVWLKRWVGRDTPRLVGEREFCTERRYVAFYTTPRLKVFTPSDFEKPYAETYICRINAVMFRGGYGTWDLS